MSAERPLFVSTWPFGKAANERSLEVFEGGGSVLDAVEMGIHVPEADAAKYSVACGAQDDPGRLDRIVGNLQGTGEDVGAAAGNHAECRHFSSRPVAQNPVENFVDDTVSTKCDHSVEAVVDGPVPEIYPVATMSGEGDFQIQFVRQRLHDHIGGSG